MADLVSSFFNAAVSRMQQERTFEMQKELQSDAQNYNTLMYNSSNTYNSPYAQMQRFKVAGLNPNLIYGQMSNIASAPSISSSNAPAAPPVAPPSLLETAQLGLIDAQRENIQADTDKKLADADMQRFEKEYKDTVTRFFDQANTFKVEHESNTEYQKGLSIAIDNFTHGYKPEIFRDENGSLMFNGDRFEREWYLNQDSFEKNRQDVLDRYKLDYYDRFYLDKVFNAMVIHDEQAYETATAELRAKSAPLKALADNEWMQFLNYLFDKFSQPALQLGGILMRRR